MGSVLDLRNEVVNFWLISDTHFGHDKLWQLFGRPKGFEEFILSNLHKIVQPDDVLIHLGDICKGDDAEWHERLGRLPFTRWLVRGNHDGKTVSWYLDHGWEFVGETFTLHIGGKEILFSHIPRHDTGYDLNIHGHFHNSTHRSDEPEMRAIKNDKQLCISIERNNYRPYNLKTLIEKRRDA